jgi:hypothetical protein
MLGGPKVKLTLRPGVLAAGDEFRAETILISWRRLRIEGVALSLTASIRAPAYDRCFYRRWWQSPSMTLAISGFNRSPGCAPERARGSPRSPRRPGMPGGSSGGPSAASSPRARFAEVASY